MSRHPLKPSPLPQVNQPVNRCLTCDAGAALAYVSVNASDHTMRPGLALLHQLVACREHARHRLHYRLEASFADTPTTRHAGFRGLLAHLAACRNRAVVVHRLDRLPASIGALGHCGTRLVFASGERLPRDFAKLLTDHQKGGHDV